MGFHLVQRLGKLWTEVRNAVAVCVSFSISLLLSLLFLRFFAPSLLETSKLDTDYGELFLLTGALTGTYALIGSIAAVLDGLQLKAQDTSPHRPASSGQGRPRPTTALRRIVSYFSISLWLVGICVLISGAGVAYVLFETGSIEKTVYLLLLALMSKYFWLFFIYNAVLALLVPASFLIGHAAARIWRLFKGQSVS
ncbi:MAG: hypothetical protein AB7P12_19010 [Alphaproteobacteria bacterium]